MACQIQPRSVDLDGDGEEKYDSIMVVYRDSQTGRSNGTLPTRKASRETMLTERTVDTEREPKGVCLCKNLSTDLCQATTIHGVNKITEESPFRGRRIVWSILVIIGFLLFIVQVIQSALLYFSYPITVNVKVTYVEEMRFPAVTICNINAFRATEAARLQVYDILSDTFIPDGKQSEQDIVLSIQQLKATNTDLSLEDVFAKTGHRREDFIISCFFKGERCRGDDWKVTMTDYGMCYTFNGGPFSKKKVRSTSQIGPQGGLKLRLNIEQYEYMNGPNQGAGIRLLVHDQMELPAVTSLGTAIPPGSHALVGMSVNKIENLPQPFGACSGGVSLDYYDYYSVQGCLQECKQKYIIDKCQCKEPYMMTEKSAKIPVCSLRQFLDCTKPAKDAFDSSSKVCTCPVPCTEKIYSTSTSLASLSSLEKDRFVATQPEMVDTMIKKYKVAKETAQKYDSMLLQRNKKLLQDLSDAVNSMEMYLKTLIKKLTDMQMEVTAVVEMVSPRLRFHRMATLSFMEMNIKHNFNRGWGIMSDSFIDYVTSGYTLVLEYFKRSVDKLDGTNRYKKAIRDYLLYDVQRYLGIRQTVTSSALKNLKEVQNAYVNGTLLNNFRFFDSVEQTTSYDKVFTPLCVRQVTTTDELDFRMTMDTLQNIMDTLDSMGNLALYVHGGNSINGTERDILANQYADLSRIYNYRISLIKDRVVDKPLEIVQKRLENFQALNTSLYDAASKIMVYITASKDSLESFLSNTFSRVKNMQQLVSRFSRSTDATKSDIATDLMSDDAENVINSLQSLLTHIQTRDRDIKDTMIGLKVAEASIYRDMLGNPCISKFYKMLRNDLSQAQNNATRLNIAFGAALRGSNLVKIVSTLLRTPVEKVQEMSSYEVMKQTNADLAPLNLDTKLRDIDKTFMFMERKYTLAPTKYNDTALFPVFTRAREQFKSYASKSTLDTAFINDNLVNVDVFVNELSYETVTQGRGYELTTLWSNIGGSLALFLGASLLTVAEVIDIIVHNAARNRRPRRPKLRRDDTSREFYL